MSHTHAYRYPTVTMLSLPDVYGYYDAVLVWHCATCPATCHATGLLHQQSRGLTPAAWEARCAQERQRGGLVAQQAARQERNKVR